MMRVGAGRVGVVHEKAHDAAALRLEREGPGRWYLPPRLPLSNLGAVATARDRKGHNKAATHANNPQHCKQYFVCYAA